jgi:uncharacterized protein
MAFYADSSFFVSLYATEPETERAIRWIQHCPEPLPFTPLHRHEVRTALRLKVYRREWSQEDRKLSFANLEADLEDATLIHIAIPWTDAFREAERIAELLEERIGVRSIDLLQIGIALAMEARDFLTFDLRQAQLAEEAGLRLVFQKRA